MHKQDITEKNLEWFNDVFADIVNAFFAINGIDSVINPDDLQDAKARTSYKSENKVREQERDVAKFWNSPDGEAVICLVGLENQTSIDTYMPLRVIGYEGADYRSQIPVSKKPHFVITIILYFGITRPWPKRRSLHERLNVPENTAKSSMTAM